MQAHLVEALISLVPVGEVLAGLAPRSHPAAAAAAHGVSSSGGWRLTNSGARPSKGACAVPLALPAPHNAAQWRSTPPWRPPARQPPLTLPPSWRRTPWRHKRCRVPQPCWAKLTAGRAGQGRLGAAGGCCMTFESRRLVPRGGSHPLHSLQADTGRPRSNPGCAAPPELNCTHHQLAVRFTLVVLGGGAGVGVQARLGKDRWWRSRAFSSARTQD